MTFPVPEDFTESSETSSTTAHTYNLPVTVNVGDRLWLWATDGDDDLAASGGSMDDWSNVFNQDIFTTYNWQLWTIYVDDGTLATALEGGTVTFSTVSAVRSSCQVARISGAPPGVAGVGFDNAVDGSTSFSQSPNPPNVAATPGSADNLFLAYFTSGATGANVDGNPTSYTPGADGDIAALYIIGTAWRQLAAASDNPDAFHIDDATSENWRAGTLVMPPGTGVTVTPARAELAVTAELATAATSTQPERAVLALAARTPAVVADIGPGALAFADGGHTNPRVEVAFNRATAASPIDYLWTDLSDRLQSRIGDLQIGTARGRADEAADTEPSSVSILLDNTDGALTPLSPLSPYWPAVDVGLPLRIWEDGATPALVLPGLTGAYAYSPDHPDFDITGDVDVRIRLEPNAWSVGRTTIDGGTALTHPQWLASKWLDGADRSWWWALFDAGWSFTGWTEDGAATAGNGSAFPRLIAALRPIWLGWTFDVDDGASGNVHTFYRYDGATPPDDITTWTAVATATNAGATSIFSGAGQLEIGSRNHGVSASLAGRVLTVQLRDGINGTLVANPDFTAQAPGTTSFADGVGKSWQLAGAAQISRRRLRFCGEVTEIDPQWPYGDHQPDTPLGGERPTEARAAITASGALRRLTRGQDPLRSTLARQVVVELDNVTAYWPCEDGRQAAQFGPGIPAVEAMTTTGLDMASDSSLPASGPLPSIAAGAAAVWSGAIPAGPSDAWTIEMVLFIETPETHPTSTQILGVTASGTIARWTVEVSDTTVTVTAYSGGGAVIATSATATGTFGSWVLFRLDVAQDGADVDWSWALIDIDTGAGGGNSGTIAGQSIGFAAGINTVTTGPPNAMSFGHIIVHDGALGLGWLAGADTAWAGESAAHRFWRLCAEEGIPAEIIGDPDAAGGTGFFRDNLANSQAMGPQQRKTLPDLLSECVAIDMAVLIEGKGIPGLIFRCRRDLEDQDVRLALDTANNDIAGIEPTRDNQALVNELTVTSISGASAAAVDTTSRDTHGRYSDSADINGVGGLDIQEAIVGTQDGLTDAINTQNIQQASWRLALGIAEGMRYPTITIDLGTAPDLIETWLATALGDRVTLTGLPAQHPADTVELLLQHIAETVTPTAWIVELTVTPGEPWLTGTLAE